MLAWDAFLTQLEKELGASVIKEWLRVLRVVQFDAANLYLEAENSFQITWFEEHIRPRLKSKFVNNNLRPISVHLRLKTPKIAAAPIETIPKSSYEIHPDPLESELTFQEFLPSSSNVIAHKFLQELSLVPSSLGTFNPLFIYGPKNSGKTHLLMATAEALQKKKKVFFVKAETFTEHVVQAIRLGMMQTFRQIYREIEVLIVDDVHIFAKKNATQEEFFHTFNTLHTAGLQIILSANAPPSQLKDIEPRLISRFEWGLCTAIDAPQNLKAILEHKARLWKLSLPSLVFDFLMEEIPSKPIEALQVLALRGGSSHIDLPIARHLLKDWISQEQKEALTAQLILQKIASHFGIKPDDLLGKSQTRECALPRQIAMYACRDFLKMPFQSIGEFFGRDHSTVMASIKQIQEGEKKQDLIETMRSCFKKEIKS